MCQLLYSAVRWRWSSAMFDDGRSLSVCRLAICFLIAGMLPLGIAMETTGTALLANQLIALVGAMPGHWPY